MSIPDKKQATPKEQQWNAGDPVDSHPVMPDGTGTGPPRQQMPKAVGEEDLRHMTPQSQLQMQPWVRCGFWPRTQFLNTVLHQHVPALCSVPVQC